MESLLWKMLSLCCLVLLQVFLGVQGKSCDLDDACAALTIIGRPKYTTLAFSSATASVKCPKHVFSGAVESVSWLYFNGTFGGSLTPLDVASDPKLVAQDYDLNLMNVSDAYEGVYYCVAHYQDGTNRTTPAGCVFIAGRAYYNHCPKTDGDEDCEAPTQLIGNVGEDLEFDSRVEFRHSGECKTTQTVRLMFLNKILDDKSQEQLFVCSNLGSLSTVPTCPNKTRVAVSYQGGDGKYDIKLSLQGLTLADSGNYQVKVEVDEYVGGRRKSILKNFNVTVEDNAVQPTELPEDESNCSRGAGTTVLLLAGEVLSNGTELNVTAGVIKKGLSALLCVTSDDDQKSSPQFYKPSGNPVSTDPTKSIYMTTGEKIARLNYDSTAVVGVSDEVPSEPLQGLYCCSVHNTIHSSCVNIVN